MATSIEQLVLAAIGDAFVALNARGSVLLASEAAARMFGWSRTELVGQCFSVLLPKPNRLSRIEFLSQVFESSQSSPMGKTWEMDAVRKNGEPLRIEVLGLWCRPTLDKEGEGPVLVAILREVHSRTTRAPTMSPALDSNEGDSDDSANQARLTRDRLRELARVFVAKDEHNRRRLAAELHDTVGQSLALAQIKLGEIQSMVPGDMAPLIKVVRNLIDNAIGVTRSLTMEIGATVLHELGLEPAMKSLADSIRERHSVDCSVKVKGKCGPLDEETRTTVYRAARELIVNAIKHGQTRSIQIELDWRKQSLQMRITDDGTGFVVPDRLSDIKTDGFGLLNIHERIRSLGGVFILKSALKSGTRATLTVPLGSGAAMARNRKQKGGSESSP